MVHVLLKPGLENFEHYFTSVCQFSSVQPLSRVRLFVTPWIAARQASLSITNSRSSLRLIACEMSVIVWQFEHSLALPFFGIGMKTDLFQSCGHCWVFRFCMVRRSRHASLFPYRLLQNIQHSSLCYTVGTYRTYMLIPNSYSSSPPNQWSWEESTNAACLKRISLCFWSMLGPFPGFWLLQIVLLWTCSCLLVTLHLRIHVRCVPGIWWLYRRVCTSSASVYLPNTFLRDDLVPFYTLNSSV